jgi:hypothetical protein
MKLCQIKNKHISESYLPKNENGELLSEQVQTIIFFVQHMSSREG